MPKDSLKSIFRKLWKIPKGLYRHFIARDIDITRNEFLSISFMFSAVVVLIVSLINSIWGNSPPTIMSGNDWQTIFIIAIITLIITGFGSGFLIDYMKLKIVWTFIILGISSVSLFLLNTGVGGLGSYILGVVIICFSILFLFFQIITILIAKTSIMERARVTAGVLIIVGITTIITLGYIQGLQLFNYSYVLFFIFFASAGIFARTVKWRTETDKFNGRITLNS